MMRSDARMRMVRSLAMTVAATWLSGAMPAAARAVDLGDAQWIWSPEHEKNQVPKGSCFFRKTVLLGSPDRPRAPERGTLEITADESYEVYVNGRRVGGSDSWRDVEVYDIKPFLVPGRNIVAVKVHNAAVGPAGLVARITVKQAGNTDVQYPSDETWKVTINEAPKWRSVAYDHSDWDNAKSYGPLGETLPWGNAVEFAEGSEGGRFQGAKGFRVERVTDPQRTGSLVTMTFDARGRILASREGGPLLRIRDADGDGNNEAVEIFSDKVQNCQGILVHDGHVFVVGEGPRGTGFYRFSDADGDGEFEGLALVLKFDRRMREHGPHAPVLGPDGMIYLVLGNHVNTVKEHAEASPYQHYYEGDLVQPRYEDAGGHARGIKVPGGIIVRTDTAGSEVELVAGGMRNAYDIAFNRAGELFTYDSDMEWDEGLPWYRPTRVCHVVPGAEFGWRSGWAKWPAYYHDSLPAVLDVGRGSPTGVTFYDHFAYPERYRDAMFIGDWSMGRILAVHLARAGGSYVAKSETFLEGRPLNVTDLEVGPDGLLYFITGGRGTEGGVYRIVWEGGAPPPPNDTPILQAVHQPQLRSTWGQAQVKAVKERIGESWGTELANVANDAETYPTDDRVRAMDIMLLVGPRPSEEFLLRLSKDAERDVRNKAAYMMGVYSTEASALRLVEMLDDESAAVRRTALESLVRCGRRRAPVVKLVLMLGHEDRHVRWAAAQALERVPPRQWRSLVLRSKDPRIFTAGAASLLAVDPQRETGLDVVAAVRRNLAKFMSDELFVDLLRTTQLALYHGKLTAEDVPKLRSDLAREFPAKTDKNPRGGRRINRELIRILVHLETPELAGKLVNMVQGSEPVEERLHAAFHARFLETGWTTGQKLALLAFYEQARELPGGHSFARYLDNVTRDFVATLDEGETRQVLEQGAEMPSAALFVMARLPRNVGSELFEMLIALDQELDQQDTDRARTLQTGIAAVLGRSRDPQAMAHLRAVYETDPERRISLAMALAQAPGGENWPILVRSLSVVEGDAAREVMRKLALVERRPEKPEAFRQVILRGLELGEDGAKYAVPLLQKWTGKRLGDADTDSEQALAAWQQWFALTYPDELPATLPVASAESRWTFDDIAGFLASEHASGDPMRGAKIFERAECVKCHRFGNRGESAGPDLTTVSRRFHTKELIESVLYPSQVVSDQYASKTVVTLDGRSFTGIVGDSGTDAIVVLQSNAEKRIIPKADIDQIVPQKKSAMPDGLFNKLSLEEIADLFAYLSQPPTQTASKNERSEQ